MVMDAGTSGWHTGNGDLRRVTAEISDIFLNPLQSFVLIFQTEVSWDYLVSGAEETQRSYPVVDADEYDIVISKQVISFFNVSSAEHETSTVEIHHDIE